MLPCVWQRRPHTLISIQFLLEKGKLMRKTALTLVTIGVLAGCAHDIDLQPAPTANTTTVPGQGMVAMDTMSGVKVIANAGSWPGTVEISEEVTPVRVRIENRSGNPILVRYSDIKLVSANGPVYAAIPPFAIDSTVAEPRLAPGYAPVTAPGFAGAGFGVAPIYSPLYPGWPAMRGTFAYDPLYYQAYGDYWRQIELPTPAMLQRALPEGRIEAGGSVEGFLYFEKVSPEAKHVELRMDIHNAERGRGMGTLEIPFIVTS
jgi:hypothetical protein